MPSMSTCRRHSLADLRDVGDAGTCTWTSSSLRSTMAISGASNASFSPGCTCRFATIPEIGARTIESLSWNWVCSTCALRSWTAANCA